ncbi:MAG: hypothetical protein IT373_01965 [Polyangiaceae bacterium]|nr:hypothetical protein [Polyangiaceae bacterium]
MSEAGACLTDGIRVGGLAHLYVLARYLRLPQRFVMPDILGQQPLEAPVLRCPGCCRGDELLPNDASLSIEQDRWRCPRCGARGGAIELASLALHGKRPADSTSAEVEALQSFFSRCGHTVEWRRESRALTVDAVARALGDRRLLCHRCKSEDVALSEDRRRWSCATCAVTLDAGDYLTLAKFGVVADSCGPAGDWGDAMDADGSVVPDAVPEYSREHQRRYEEVGDWLREKGLLPEGVLLRFGTVEAGLNVATALVRPLPQPVTVCKTASGLSLDEELAALKAAMLGE